MRKDVPDYDAQVIGRVTYLAAYAALAALGEALVARPALLWVNSQGVFSPALAWDVPYGALLLACAILLALFTFGLASGVALGRKPRPPLHVAFLLAVGICFALRSASGDPLPPRDPKPALLHGLRTAADELDRGYAGLYAPDAGQFSSALAQVAPPGFRRLGRAIALHARILSGADGPQLEALPGDQPGTIYVAIAKDRQSAWLTALGLYGIVQLSSAKPAVAVARQGTHSLPGGDPGLPAYLGR
ncbi:MAG: hypothetical protein ACXWLR_12965 [Myxococcales bacterium]